MPTEISNLLFKKFTKILKTGEFSDTEILVGKKPFTKTFHLHSFILKVGSPYFRTAFSDNWAKVENGIIKFEKPNIPVKIFEILIRYIYGNEPELGNYDFTTNIALLIAADELFLKKLCTLIEVHLLKDENLLKQNFILIHDITSKYPHFDELSRFCSFALFVNPSVIFKANDFIKIEKEVFLITITKYHRSLNPIEIWDKLVEWANVQLSKQSIVKPPPLKGLIQPFVQFIDFKKISRENFYQKIRPYKNNFDDNFYIEIIDHYAFNDIQIQSESHFQWSPLPQDYSASNKRLNEAKSF
ncbi:hypothetical protein RclHR1_04060011 [Rhizophagus clarus]|uniref:BTB/POZ protein n=1 Tax=Rhizophagus clarus TaxID=94130 RepID=A0A2Z6RIZ9_9GLOM|nr:hypothetical protein RclHR1_04060011 [Rhizophagus clarus]GES98336.1 BTB/POZ protein [Rhizophagus clarus]